MGKFPETYSIPERVRSEGQRQQYRKDLSRLKISKESLSEEFSKHIVSVQEPPVINHAPDSGPIATDNKPETPSKQDQKRVSFKEKLA